MKNVVVIAVHPDDETLGCGGTLLKHKNNGDNIFWIIVTKAFKEKGFSDIFVANRVEQIETVSKKYGFNKVFELEYPTCSLDNVPYEYLINDFTKVFKEIKPNIIYLPYKNDVHTDHKVVFETAFSCTKKFRFPSIEKIYMMETISETDFAPAINECIFVPNCYVNITDFFEMKKDIINVYSSELKPHPFPRNIKNIEAIATLRGSQCGYEYAESFMLLKEIIK